MKILVTSGGTKIPIDKVRDITNMSKGTFGSKIAFELLWLCHEVMFLKAKNSESPFQITINYADGNGSYAMEKANLITDLFYDGAMNRYKEMEYSTFDEYRDRLERWIKIERPDIVMLAAAVSDYGVENPHDGKIRSNDLLTIKLVQLPKIIHLIKTWHPTCKLVGFKLLVGSKEYELVNAAKRSIAENGCDMIVANDLADIKDGKHKVHLVFPNDKTKLFKTDVEDRNFLARMVAEHTVNL
jgi:phosphopantothenate-cysteine ligase